MTILLFTVFIGIAAFATDVGGWYTDQRRLQSAADAAVLAAAQDLPDTTTAGSTATSYVNKNASALNSWSPSFPDTYTIDVRLSKNSPSFLARVFGITSVTVHAHARAIVGTPSSITNALPIGVKSSVVCASTSTGCFGVGKTLTFDDSTTASFSSSTWGLLDLGGGTTSSSTCSGKVGESSQASWVTNGYPGTLTVNQFYGATTGQRTSIRTALNARINQVLLIPVFDNADLSWCNTGGFHVVGWAAFVIDTAIPNANWNPHLKIIHGYFTQFIAHDVAYTPGVSGGFGVKVVALTE